MGDALERLVSLSRTHVGAYTRRSKSGKIVRVDAHTRQFRDWDKQQLIAEAIMLNRASATTQERNRRQQILNELRRRDEADLLERQSRPDTEGEKVDPDMYPEYTPDEDRVKFDEEWNEDYDWGRDNDDTYDGFKAYTNTGHWMMNRVLRGVENDESQTGDLERMDKMWAERFRDLSKNLRLRRWVEATDGFNPERWKKGTRVTDKGWVSTTYSENSADNFGDWQIDLLAPKGTQYLPGEVGERELILKRGTRFQVTYIDRINKIVEAVVLND